MTGGVVWPWFVIAGLGIFHGLNPAMGWLFAVALGLHRGSRRAVIVALVPLAAGHAVSIGIVAGAALVLGAVADLSAVQAAAGVVLLIWAGYHFVYGHRHRVRVGMTVSVVGLAVWSFLMATAHGAGLMLVPALLPLCSGMPALAGRSLLIALTAVAVHTLATLLVTGVVAMVVYEWLGLGVLRRGWINFDLLWTGALVATGLGLIVTA
jgi:hypothetical protein